MDSQEVGVLLQECLEEAEIQRDKKEELKPTEEQRQAYGNCRDALCLELSSLLQEAEQMQWPFAPEKWQFKQSVEASDKTNLSDLIKKNLHPLLGLLKASIQSQEPVCALAVVFLVDRFLYWTDESSRLLKITKLLHKLHPEAPVAPQLVIRQARVYLNSGKLQKAEYILSSLINNSGTTGCWQYQSDSDRALVQAVSVQVRGMILQKLGLWLEAAELIWASVVGYYALPKPDKKGIGTSLGLLANILVSMNDEDFSAFKDTPDIDLSLLGESSHRLLSAAQAAKMAVVYSQYTSLYVLTNVVSQGTSLLSYSFSIDCPSSLCRSYLLQAQEAFEIGLLTKSSTETVTSIQELHTFLKSAYSLAITKKWLGANPSIVNQAKQACQKALGLFYDYCNAQNQEKDALCSDIMKLIGKVKDLLQVAAFENSDKLSFIPDSYKNIQEKTVDFNLEKFSKMILKFKKFHATLSEMDRSCKSVKGEQTKYCITAFGTTVGNLNPECSTQSNLHDTNTSSSDDLGSSWNKISFSNSLRSGSSGSATAARIQSLTKTDHDQNPSSFNVENLAKSLTSSSASSQSWSFQLQAALETVDTDSDLEKVVQSLSDSYGSTSSWEKLSPFPRSKPMLSKVGSKSSESSDSIFHLETLDSETPDPLNASSNNGNPNMANGNAVVSSKPNLIEAANQCASTEPSTDSSFEILEQVKIENQEEKKEHRDDPKEEKNAQCHSCLNGSFGSSSEGQYVLTEQDYNALLGGVCHPCLLKRLNSDTTFKLKEHRMAYAGLHLKFSKTTGLWTARETCVYIGEDMHLTGKQRAALWVQFLHQEERLSSYVGKDYLQPRPIEFHLKDVERQMTAQFYVTQFNKSLYEREQMAQIFFIPSEALLILEGNQIVGCVTVEPYMLGEFVKLTNNTVKKQKRLEATKYGLAFGHFTYLISGGQEVVVDLQGWVTGNGKGLTYLTDPQIHSTKTPKGPSNFAERGLRYFLSEQHGPKCNEICEKLQLPPVPSLSSPIPQSL
ncbi:alpha-protein kinase 1 [Boleophthalmus pectinirostris]|uniref:alpha-protein kinase 1 n=1 Tax=Boleophthalmus pectinirostris TaxID=150288 RepID=UPI000A1C68E0|nr:alpha-protein kinase 1 [Boleophthalmus pectinirostris]XP_055012560.1 alpha-protein kinase 1 [Boleophthalmus pectinirostris]